MENNPSNHLTNLEKSLPSLCYFDEDFYNKELSDLNNLKFMDNLPYS